MQSVTAVRVLTLGLVAVTLALSGVAWDFHRAETPVGAQGADLVDVVQQYIDAYNAGDVDAAVHMFADDAVMASRTVCHPTECVGKDAIRNATEYTIVESRGQIVVRGFAVSGSTVRMVGYFEFLAFTGQTPRMLYSADSEVEDGKISELRVTFDVGDPETARAIAGWDTWTTMMELGPGRDADQSPGTARLLPVGVKTEILMTIPAGPVGMPQPAHIHEGTCDDLGDAVFRLQDVGGGISATYLDIPLGELQAGDFALNVQKSHDEPDVYVACGDISAAAEEPLIAPAAGSGGLLAEEGNGLATWWYVLAGGGALLVAAGYLGLARTRNRT